MAKAKKYSKVSRRIDQKRQSESNIDETGSSSQWDWTNPRLAAGFELSASQVQRSFYLKKNASTIMQNFVVLLLYYEELYCAIHNQTHWKQLDSKSLWMPFLYNMTSTIIFE